MPMMIMPMMRRAGRQGLPQGLASRLCDAVMIKVACGYGLRFNDQKTSEADQRILKTDMLG